MSTMNGELGNTAFTITSAQTRYSTSTLARKEYDDTAFSLAEQKYQAFLRRKLRTAVPLPHFTVAQMETSWTECKEPDIPARPKEKQTDGNIFGSKKYPTNGLAALNGAKPCDSAHQAQLFTVSLCLNIWRCVQLKHFDVIEIAHSLPFL